MKKYAVIGADGQIGKLLVDALLAKKKHVVAISRQWNNQKSSENIEYRTADAMDRPSLLKALKGCDVAYSVLGLPYDIRVWQTQWLPMTQNVLDAAKAHKLKLIYLDNVYAYGLVQGAMTEKTPYNPCSKKGQVRAEAAELIQQAMRSGDVTALIARSADFIGPGAGNSIVGERFFKPIVSSQEHIRKVQWLGDPDTKHCYNFILDNVHALVVLGEAGNDAYGQTWHLPTSSPITGRELCALIGKQAGCEIKPKPVGRWMLRMAGLFSRPAREQIEMQYQVDNDYVFDDSKFMHAFPTFHKTAWPKVIADSLAFFEAHSH